MTATADVTTAVAWVPCQGWFSGRAHDERAWIGVAKGRVTEITTTPPAGGRQLVDEPSLFAVPSLADTHVHFYMDPWPVAPSGRTTPGSKPFETEVIDAIDRLEAALASGVGLLRDMGDPHGINLEVKRRVAARRDSVPELLVAGAGFHRPKKYGRFLGVCRESVAEIIASIDELHARGEIDYVKVVTTGIVDFAERRVKQAPQFTVEELSAVVSHAHELGYKVASHCSGEEGIDINLAAGVDFIEHAYFVREDQIDRMAEQGVAWTPTFAPVHAQGFHPECGWADDVRRNIGSILREHADRIAYAASRGVTILVGTDAGSPGVSMGEGVRLELNRLATAGLPPETLLNMATVGNARSLGVKAYSPAIEIGAPASFALYERCPWRDIENLNSLRAVFWRGERVVLDASENAFHHEATKSTKRHPPTGAASCSS